MKALLPNRSTRSQRLTLSVRAGDLPYWAGDLPFLFPTNRPVSSWLGV